MHRQYGRKKTPVTILAMSIGLALQLTALAASAQDAATAQGGEASGEELALHVVAAAPFRSGR